MVRKRKSVWSLGDDSVELQQYGDAVAAMRERGWDQSDSWTWQGAVHGYSQNLSPWPDLVSPAQPDKPEWQQCQHQTWFFLPWHRGYLACFEAMVAKLVYEIHGVDDWALPYWDYSSDDPNARKLPRAFLGETRPDGSDNPLWSLRRPNFDVDPDFEIPAEIVDTGPAMGVDFFPGVGMGIPPGFGGPRTDFMHYGSRSGFRSGALEMQPHNLVHGAVGGWMGNPDTAALDPIFWLHHANIDRLWVQWVERYGEDKNPSDARWRTGTSFTLHDADGNEYSFDGKDMVDTRAVLHGYEYDDQASAAVVHAVAEEGPAMAERREAELVGASDTGVSLAGGSARVTVRIDPQAVRFATEAVGGGEPPRQTWLSVDNVTGLRSGAIYRVLVRAPGGGEPVRAGFLSSFVSTMGADSPEGAAGGAFDVTEALAGAGLGTEGATELEILFEEVLPADEQASALEGVDDAPRVGRVNLFHV